MGLDIQQIVHGFIQRARLSGVGELENSFLEELVDGFESQPKEARRAIRKLMLHDNLRFFSSACRILKSGLETPGHEYVMKLLLEGDVLLAPLADPNVFAMDTAVALAQALILFDPLLDFKLMQLLFGGDPMEVGEIDAGRALRVLEIIEALPKHTRILPLLLKMLRSSNSRLRSKAVLLFCKISKNPQWAERRLSDLDARVRANAIEGLWGADIPWARTILREAAHDADHRVMANALVGLYYLDGREIAAQLDTMARSPSPLARAAAAFAMGQIRDDYFVQLLSTLLKDFNAKVRGAALRALIKIRRKPAQGVEEAALEPGDPATAAQPPEEPDAVAAPVEA